MRVASQLKEQVLVQRSGTSLHLIEEKSSEGGAEEFGSIWKPELFEGIEEKVLHEESENQVDIWVMIEELFGVGQASGFKEYNLPADPFLETWKDFLEFLRKQVHLF